MEFELKWIKLAFNVLTCILIPFLAMGVIALMIRFGEYVSRGLASVEFTATVMTLGGITGLICAGAFAIGKLES